MLLVVSPNRYAVHTYLLVKLGGGGMKRSADDSGMDAGPSKRFCNGEGPTVELRVLIQSKVCYFHNCLVHKL